MYYSFALQFWPELTGFGGCEDVSLGLVSPSEPSARLWMSSVVKRLESISRMWIIDFLLEGLGCKGDTEDERAQIIKVSAFCNCRIHLNIAQVLEQKLIKLQNLHYTEFCVLYLYLNEFLHLLMGQWIQLLDVRCDEGVEAGQNLIYRQGRQEETQSLHQPHALAALYTQT